MIHGRFFECRLWLYQPFLYYAIHSSIHATHWEMVQPFVHKAIATCLRGLGQAPTTHRHHGTFFELRTVIVFALCVIAASRCDALSSQLEHDWKEQVQGAMNRMQYWQDECPGIREAVEMVGQLLP
jgi:hypothetical protein